MTDHQTEIAHDTVYYGLLNDYYAACDKLSMQHEYLLHEAAYDGEGYGRKMREARSEEKAYEKFPVGTIYSLYKNYQSSIVIVREPRLLGEGGEYERLSHFHYAPTVAEASAVLAADNERVVAYNAAAAARQAASDAIDAHDAAGYTGWTRYLLCTSSNGHVHADSHCSTCRPSTRFAPVVSLSGCDATEAIEKLGETLCSVCYPDAPVTGKIGKLTKKQVKGLLAEQNAAVAS